MARKELTDTEAAALWNTEDSATGHDYSDPTENYTHNGIRQEQRYLRMTDVSDALRVDMDTTTDLDYMVNAGDINFRGAVVSYAGTTGETLTDDATNYIYLDLTTGAAVLTVSTSAFPTDMVTTPHIQLAEIKTGSASALGTSGEYAYGDITDKRDSGAWQPLDIGEVVEESTVGVATPNVLTAAETGKVFSNEGSTETNYHTLPTAVAGLKFTFVCADASDDIRITAGAGDTIRHVGSVTIAGGYIESTEVGCVASLIAVNATKWIAVILDGTWTFETS